MPLLVCISCGLVFGWETSKCVDSACFYFVRVVPKPFAIVFIVAMSSVIILISQGVLLLKPLRLGAFSHVVCTDVHL